MKAWEWIAIAAVIVLLVAAGVTKLVIGTASSGSPAPPLPASMASAGDSITRAFDVTSQHLFQDAPLESWSTGSDPAIVSQYDRILAAQPAIAGHTFNDAQTGAKLAALDHQLALASLQHVDYVTVLMGANDLCTPTVASMTPTDTVRAELTQSLTHFFAADPGAHVLVASIPDVFQLWSTLSANPLAEATWSLAHICQSMLSLTATPVDRAAVVAQEITDNGVLQTVCAHFANCRFDGLAVYRAGFTAADVSTVDYFHPNISGQKKLALATWAAGYWPATP